MPNKDHYETVAFHQWSEEHRQFLGLSFEWIEQHIGINSGTLHRAIKKDGALTSEQRKHLIRGFQILLRAAAPGQHLDIVELERMSGVDLTLFVPVHDLIAIAHELCLEFPREHSRVAVANGLMPGDPCHDPLAQVIATLILDWRVLQFEEDAWLAQAKAAEAGGDWAYWADCTLHAALMSQYRLDFFRADQLLETVSQAGKKRLPIGQKAVIEARLRRGWNYYRDGNLYDALTSLRKAEKALQNWHPSPKDHFTIFFRQQLHFCNGQETRDILEYLIRTNLSNVLIEQAIADMKEYGKSHNVASNGLKSKHQLEQAQSIRLRIPHRVSVADDWQAEFRLALIAITQNATKREVGKQFTRAKATAEGYVTGEHRIALYQGMYLMHPDLSDRKSVARGRKLIEEAKVGYHVTSPIFYAPGAAAVLVAESSDILEDADATEADIAAALRKLFLAANVHPSKRNIDLLTDNLSERGWELEEFESPLQWTKQTESELTVEEWLVLDKARASRSPIHQQRVIDQIESELLAEEEAA